MKVLIVYASYHHMNTQKIALAMAQAIGAEPVLINEAQPEEIASYELIGLGSGIYYGKFHKKMLFFMKQAVLERKKTFVFSTSGFGAERYNSDTLGLLLEKGADNLGSFHCRGYDTYPLFKVVGGLSKGYPDEDDLQDAEAFAKEMLRIAEEG
jgi:flavodoxin